MSRRRDEIFLKKLTINQKYEVCLRLAFYYTPEQIQRELAGQGIQITAQGIRKYLKRKKWRRVIDGIRANLVNRPEGRRMIEQVVGAGFEGLIAEFGEARKQILDELRLARAQDRTGRIDMFNAAGVQLGIKFENLLDRASKMMPRLSNVQVKSGLAGDSNIHLCARERL